MVRFEGETPGEVAPTTEEHDGGDTLFERWLARFPASQRRVRVAAATAAVPEPREPIGDDIADRWFR